MLLGFCLTPLSAIAEGQPGLVEIEYPAQIFADYRDRRPNSNVTFGIQYENYAPVGYVSGAAPAAAANTYSAVYGDQDMPLTSLYVGYKYNLPFMGVETSLFYGMGGLIDARIGETIDLDVKKYGVKFAGYLDSIFKEPYFVPYGAVQIQFWGITEKGQSLEFNRSTGYTIGLQLGALIQLNWVEPETALFALNESGLNNTFLDVFMQQYGDTSDATDPKLASEFNWGLGIRLEY